MYLSPFLWDRISKYDISSNNDSSDNSKGLCAIKFLSFSAKLSSWSNRVFTRLANLVSETFSLTSVLAFDWRALNWFFIISSYSLLEVKSASNPFNSPSTSANTSIKSPIKFLHFTCSFSSICCPNVQRDDAYYGDSLLNTLNYPSHLWVEYSKESGSSRNRFRKSTVVAVPAKGRPVRAGRGYAPASSAGC